ncbi:hypothetical protein SAMD00019534_054910, partial [Acytostelium subglobosum LB1]|uniref:hypothetical protein n=1 Tax=Acytostelium subglobosum LB1 TaxID=1410327 RepID=UPI000644F254
IYYIQMATPFIIGLAVAGAAYATRGAIRIASKIKADPRSIFNAGGSSATAMGSFTEGFATKMNKKEAAAVLGIEESADEKTIKEKHKKLMIRNHPDKGGSSYLATKVNEAKNVMLGRQSS